jgi:hypothetical protein
MFEKPVIDPSRHAEGKNPMTVEEQENFVDDASTAYHAYGAHTSDCQAFQSHYGRRCDCEKAGYAALRLAGYPG